MVSGNIDACTSTIYLACDILSIPIKSIFDYLILWFHIMAIPYILIFIKVCSGVNLSEFNLTY